MALATQCPHCYTSFRVANDQLKLSAGLVRCGVCQQTFNGIDHLLSPGQAPKVRPETPVDFTAHTIEPAASFGNTFSNTSTNTNVTTEELEVESISLPDQDTLHINEIQTANNTANLHDENSSLPQTQINEHQTQLTVESQSDQIIEVVENVDLDSKEKEPIKTPIDDTIEVESSINTLAFEIEVSPTHDDILLTKNRAELKNTLDQMENGQLIHSEITHVEQVETQTNPHDISPAHFIDASHESTIDITKNTSLNEVKENVTALVDDEFNLSSIDAKNEPSFFPNETENKEKSRKDQWQDPVVDKKIEPQSDSIESLIHHTAEFDPEEVKPQFMIEAEKKQKYGKWITAMYCFLALLFLISALGQFTFYFRNHVFAHVPQARASLLKACNLLNCSIHLLAEKGAVTKESQELVLLSSNPQILTLSVLLQNRSNTAQAWPMIELTLTDNRKKTLLQKVFTPKEYLDNPKDINRGIAANIEKNVDVNFELDIPKAASYEVKLFYP